MLRMQKVEQLDLQQNLEYSLRHQAKQYIQTPSLTEALTQQIRAHMLTNPKQKYSKRNQLTEISRRYTPK